MEDSIAEALSDTTTDTTTTDTTTLRPRRIEFLGDSITAGFCNLCDSTGTNTAATESYADSWANLICQSFDAECHTSAWSGYGVVENCCGGKTLMSDVWRRTLASVPSSNASDPHGTNAGNVWNFSTWIPDVVVINLGTNDELQSRPNNIEKYNATYLSLLQQASAEYGSGTIFFLACGPMSESYCDPVDWILDQASVLGIRAKFLDQRGFLDGKHGKSCCGHPSATVDRAMAEAGAAVIGNVTGWRGSYLP